MPIVIFDFCLKKIVHGKGIYCIYLELKKWNIVRLFMHHFSLVIYKIVVDKVIY